MLGQLFIAITELIAVYLLQNNKYAKYASFFGLAAQPFWFYSSYIHEQWGMFFICFLFTLLWIKNYKQFWIDKQVDYLTNEEYYDLIVSAAHKIKTSKLEQIDYIERVLKEALRLK